MVDMLALVQPDHPTLTDAPLGVSEVARRYGFRYSVQVSAALWADLHAIPTALASEQDATRRLHDLLWTAAVAVRCAPADAEAITFPFELAVAGQEEAACTICAACTLDASSAPVITLMHADEVQDDPH